MMLLFVTRFSVGCFFILRFIPRWDFSKVTAEENRLQNKLFKNNVLWSIFFYVIRSVTALTLSSTRFFHRPDLFIPTVEKTLWCNLGQVCSTQNAAAC
ncbi:hypothetical protein SAMN05421665_2619 [Yoonia rosea]|uniref:Uncharacterized protein n=1 Tax=Yoonia rosea TaxID=287098 RepID=A0A1R3XA52_9RHOB|nr:hypothetical protein SAMN05421665_2619 [Yoonia rosea]